MKQYSSDTASSRIVGDPSPNDADENTAHYQEDKVHGVERAHLAWHEESGQMPDGPDRTQDRFFLRDSDRFIEKAHKVLDELSFESAFAKGQTLLLDEALSMVSEMLEEL